MGGPENGKFPLLYVVKIVYVGGWVVQKASKHPHVIKKWPLTQTLYEDFIGSKNLLQRLGLISAVSENAKFVFRENMLCAAQNLHSLKYMT